MDSLSHRYWFFCGGYDHGLSSSRAVFFKSFIHSSYR